MSGHQLNPTIWTPSLAFYVGLALVLLAMGLPFLPAWYTFIHMWRVELAASLFLFSTLAYLAFRFSKKELPLSLSFYERWMILAPLLAFIVWSGLSTLWAPSWKSVVHHTLIWSEYLIFFLICRYLIDQHEHFGKLLKTLTFVLVLFAIPALVEFLALTAFGGDTFFRARFAKYGEQIVTILPLILAAVVRLRDRKLYAGIGCVVLLWLLVYCTAGLVNLLLFGVGVAAMAAVIFGVTRFDHYRKRFALCILCMLLAPVPFFLFSVVAGRGDVPVLSRFQDAGGVAYSRDFRVLMTSVSLEMVKSEPIKGVGADNYGLQFNNFREQYAAKNASDPNLSYGEMGIVGHAHNEFIQIVAELGVVGGLLFLWLVAGIGFLVMRAVRGLRKGASLYSIAAVLGLMTFLASSAVSAYSFRVMQNGFVFFFVLAVATKGLFKDATDVSAEPVRHVSSVRLRLGLAMGMAACLLLASYSIVRVASVVVTTRANYTEDLEQASALYRLGMNLDDENPDARNNFAMRLFQEDRFADSASLLQESIRIGRAQSVDFSYLASAQSLAGDDQSAERTMAAAVKLYPQSPFVLTRHAALLQAIGMKNASAREFGKAHAIDHRAANSWWLVINSGAKAATDNAFRSSDYTPVMELQPQKSMYAVLDERYVRFPAERPMFRLR